MAGHEVDAVIRFARAGLVEVGAAQQARRQRRGHACVALHELAHIVAEDAVPLRPSSPRRQCSHLVQTGRVPGFGDQLGIGQHGIVGHGLQQRRVLQHAAVLPATKDRCQVEAEAVHVHLGDPVAQAIDDEVAHHRVVAVHRVAASGVVQVLAGLGIEDVVGRVVDAAKRPGWPVLVALGGVVEHHVEDDFDAGLVHRLDELLEFAHLLAVVTLRRICRVGREKRGWLIAPEIHQRLAREGIDAIGVAFLKFVDRQAVRRQ